DMTVIGMTGAKGAEFAAMCDVALVTPHTVTPNIQEKHLAMGHAFCLLVERTLFPAGTRSTDPRPTPRKPRAVRPRTARGVTSRARTASAATSRAHTAEAASSRKPAATAAAPPRKSRA